MLEMLCTELMYEDKKNLFTQQLKKIVQGLVESKSDVTKDEFLFRGLKTNWIFLHVKLTFRVTSFKILVKFLKEHKS